MFQIRCLNRPFQRGEYSDFYQKSFSAWHRTWEPEYRAIQSDGELKSDNFTRQDQILSLFYQNECVALTFFNGVNIATAIGRKDSYFASWPKEVLYNIANESQWVLVCSALTVCKDYQGQSIEGIPIKDLIAAASIDHFIRSSFSIMVGTMRNNRGANNLVYKFGALPLGTVECNSEPSDLVLFKRESIQSFPSKIRNMLDLGRGEHSNPNLNPAA